jgi:hypothetical protein
MLNKMNTMIRISIPFSTLNGYDTLFYFNLFMILYFVLYLFMILFLFKFVYDTFFWFLFVYDTFFCFNLFGFFLILQ